MKDSNEPVDPDESIPDEVDAGLALAYGAGLSMPASPSVLARITDMTGSVPRLILREAEGEAESPLLRPLGAEDRFESGKYIVHGELGRGGVGAVHRGHDQDLGRDVALKFLHDRFKDDPAITHRFVEEAQIGGQLQHPGIVPVYDLGESMGKLFFAMKLVKGETLARRLSDRTSLEADRPALLSIFEDVCQTMAYAHARGVVHRDLKPSNIMIGSFGEVQVVDWGMGKVLGSGGVHDEDRATERQTELSVIETTRSSGSGSQSITGSIMGTPAYMPPEQARGDVLAMDERSDVFALGALLCELLTGLPPYVGERDGLIKMAAMCRLDDALSRLSACGADPLLVDLAIECLMPAPAARPESAGVVASRMREYLSSLEGRAQQAELRASAARHRNRMTLLAAVSAFLLLALGSATWVWVDRIERARQDQAMERVVIAREAASNTRTEAQASGHDPQLWAAAVASAAQVALLCEDELVDVDTRSAAAAALIAAQQAELAARDVTQRQERDAQMLERLEALRSPRLEMESQDLTVQRRASGWEPADSASQRAELFRLDKAYTSAFDGYLDGESLLTQDREAVLEALRSGNIEPELATALDLWTLLRDTLGGLPGAPDALGTDRIHWLASQLDVENSWRSDLRSMIRRAPTEGTRLRGLAEADSVAKLSAADAEVLGEALWRAGEKDAAIETLQRGQRIHPEDLGLCLRLAVRLEGAEDPRFEEAIGLYRIAQALRPGWPDPLRLEGRALIRLERGPEAVQLYRMAAARDPENALWFGEIGIALHYQGKDDEALLSLRRGFELDPREPVTGLELGKALFRQGEYAEAAAHLQTVLEFHPQLAMAHSDLAATLHRQGKHRESVEHAQMALEIEPGVIMFHKNLAVTLEKIGDEEGVIASWQHVIDFDPSDALAHDALGAALARNGSFDRAIPILEQSILLAPTNAQAHRLLGFSHREVGNLERAIELLERSLELNPVHMEAFEGLALVYEAQGNLDEAYELHLRALDLVPRNARAHYNLGNIHKKWAEYDEATARYREAIAIWAPRSDSFAVLWKQRAETEIENCRAMDGEQAFLRGDRLPDIAMEFNWAALRGFEQGRDREVTAMAERTFARSPELLADRTWRTYYACRCAARVASGESPDPDPEERAHLRHLARVWLLREIDILQTRLTSSETAARARKRLIQLRDGEALESMRGAAIETLPEADRESWRSLWLALDDVLSTGER